MSSSIKLVCFDLGGVMVRVATTWAQAMRAAGIVPTVSEDLPLHAAPPFDPYQAGQLTTEEYATGLAAFLQVSELEAINAHDHILIEPTEGTLAIVQALNQTVKTACLSNTNELHWRELVGPRFPNIQALQTKLASQDLGLAKPDHAIFKRFEEITKTPGDQILFFEDTLPNIESARAVGWNVVAINPLSPQAPQIRSALAEFDLLA